MSARTVAMKDDTIANSMYMCVITKILESFERLLLLYVRVPQNEDTHKNQRRTFSTVCATILLTLYKLF
jgi:hypothetical protein